LVDPHRSGYANIHLEGRSHQEGEITGKGVQVRRPLVSRLAVFGLLERRGAFSGNNVRCPWQSWHSPDDQPGNGELATTHSSRE